MKVTIGSIVKMYGSKADMKDLNEMIQNFSPENSFLKISYIEDSFTL
jgi:hypothetical protein